MTSNERCSALPDADRANARLLAGRLGEPELGHLARRLAILHESEAVDPEAARHAGPGALAARARALRDEMLIAEAESPQLAAALRGVADLQEGFVATHPDWIQARIDAQRIRAGARDRHLENVWIDDHGNVTLWDDDKAAPQPSLPGRDGCLPGAGLSVDLASLGYPELAERLLAAYAGEFDDYALYRTSSTTTARSRLCTSTGRCALRARRSEIAVREAAAADARRLLDFACTNLPSAGTGRGGPRRPGGQRKSTVARAIADDGVAAHRGDHVRAFRGRYPSHEPTPVERLEGLEAGFDERVARASSPRPSAFSTAGAPWCWMPASRARAAARLRATWRSATGLPSASSSVVSMRRPRDAAWLRATPRPTNTAAGAPSTTPTWRAGNRPGTTSHRGSTSSSIRRDPSPRASRPSRPGSHSGRRIRALEPEREASFRG
jgi:hypothetical protein